MKHMFLFLKNFFSPNNNKILLDPGEKRELESLTQVPFDKLSQKEKDELLQLGAKDFQNKFGEVIRKLANE